MSGDNPIVARPVDRPNRPNPYAAFAEDDALAEKTAVEAMEAGVPVIELGGAHFMPSDTMHAWHMIQLAKAEKRGDLMGALAAFAEFIDHCVAEHEVERLNRYMAVNAITLADLRDDVGKLLMSAATQAGFGDEEDEDPTGPPKPGRPTPAPTNESS